MEWPGVNGRRRQIRHHPNQQMLRQAERPGVTGWRDEAVMPTPQTWRGRVGITVAGGRTACEQDLAGVSSKSI